MATGLSASKVSGPAHGVLTLQPNGSFTYTPQAGYAGIDSFVYKTTSGALSANATAQITVAAAGASLPPPSTAPSSGSPASSSPGPSGELPATDPLASPGASAASPDASGAGVSPGGSQVAGSVGPGPSGVVPAGSDSGAGGDATPLLIALAIVVVGLAAGLYAFVRRRRGGGSLDPAVSRREAVRARLRPWRLSDDRTRATLYSWREK